MPLGPLERAPLPLLRSAQGRVSRSKTRSARPAVDARPTIRSVRLKRWQWLVLWLMVAGLFLGFAFAEVRKILPALVIGLVVAALLPGYLLVRTWIDKMTYEGSGSSVVRPKFSYERLPTRCCGFPLSAPNPFRPYVAIDNRTCVRVQ
jgi:hypothetical protein